MRPKGSLEDSRTGEKPVGVFIFDPQVRIGKDIPGFWIVV